MLAPQSTRSAGRRAAITNITLPDARLRAWSMFNNATPLRDAAVRWLWSFNVLTSDQLYRLLNRRFALSTDWHSFDKNLSNWRKAGLVALAGEPEFEMQKAGVVPTTPFSPKLKDGHLVRGTDTRLRAWRLGIVGEALGALMHGELESERKERRLTVLHDVLCAEMTVRFAEAALAKYQRSYEPRGPRGLEIINAPDEGRQQRYSIFPDAHLNFTDTEQPRCFLVEFLNEPYAAYERLRDKVWRYEAIAKNTQTNQALRHAAWGVATMPKVIFVYRSEAVAQSLRRLIPAGEAADYFAGLDWHKVVAGDPLAFFRFAKETK